MRKVKFFKLIQFLFSLRKKSEPRSTKNIPGKALRSQSALPRTELNRKMKTREKTDAKKRNFITGSFCLKTLPEKNKKRIIPTGESRSS
jgi:hypothetical protein